METEITPGEVAARLLCSMVAGLVIGINREERGRPAGLRTTLLVCMAAAGAMILASLLVDTGGRPWNSYVTMDVMRLPLGILTGVGFIGAGAILQKGNFVLGVTTAATLWFSSVMGLCFGAGEFALGAALLGVAAFTLWGLRYVERHWCRRVEASVSVTFSSNEGSGDTITKILRGAGYTVTPLQSEWTRSSRRYRFEIHKHNPAGEAEPPPELVKMADEGAIELSWSMHP